MIPAGLEPAILLLRRQSLYPTELRNQTKKINGLRHFYVSDSCRDFSAFCESWLHVLRTRSTSFSIFCSTSLVGFELSAFFSEKTLASVARSIRRRMLYPAELQDLRGGYLTMTRLNYREKYRGCQCLERGKERVKGMKNERQCCVMP